MRILAIEASTQEASCALLSGDALIERRLDPALPSSETLLPAIERLLAEAGIGIDGLDAIAYGAGPGAFTGLRVAIGITQGLAFARNLPTVGVETLAAVAYEALVADSDASGALAALDARMNEIYAATYEREREGKGGPLGQGLRRIGPITLASASAVNLQACSAGWLACGNAAAAYPGFAARVAGFRASEIRLPRAAAVARLGALALARGEGQAAELALPLYVRDRVAETVAERLAKGGRA